MQRTRTVHRPFTHRKAPPHDAEPSQMQVFRRGVRAPPAL